METACKNCGAALKGPWCHQCGQKKINERLSLSYVWENITSSFLNLEKGFLYTIRSLAIEPGNVVRGYLDGATIRYYNPIRYSLVIMGAYSLFFVYSGLYELYTNNMFDGMANGAAIDNGISTKQKELMAQIKGWMNLLSILVVPFLALGNFLVFRKSGHNYAEHILVGLYLQSQSTMYGTVFTLPALLWPEHIGIIMGASMLLPYFVLVQFIHGWLGISGYKVFLRSLLAYILTFLFYTLFSGLMGAAWGLANSF